MLHIAKPYTENSKWQPAKVDGGGGTTRAIALVSGEIGGK